VFGVSDRCTEEERMDAICFDVLTRRASVVSVGSAGLAALSIPIATAGKKSKHKKKGDVNKLCEPQVEQCLAFFGPDDCDSDSRCACCSFLGTCDITAFYDCLASAIEA
jgi:hypothetical protein